MYLLNEGDFEDYLMILAKEKIKIASALNTRIVRATGVSVNESLTTATALIVDTIKKNGCMAQEDILDLFPIFSEQFLQKILAKYADEIVLTEINEYLCYQSIEELGLDQEFADAIEAVIDEVDMLSLRPSQDIIHALLSVHLKYNVIEELGIPDDKTFRRIVSMYYQGPKQRSWKYGCYVEAELSDV